MKRLLPALAGLAIAAAGAAFLLGDRAPGQTEITGFGAAEAQASEVDTSGIVEMTLGNPEAEVRVIEYASFTCPHCRRWHDEVFEQFKADYVDTGEVEFVYREVYFDRFGLWAGMVARCAGPERYFGVVDLLYETQGEWARQETPAEIAAALRKLGLSAGIQPDALDACLQDAAKAEAMYALYQQNAEADGIRSTPSFVIDGTTYQNMAYSEMSDLIDAALGK